MTNHNLAISDILIALRIDSSNLRYLVERGTNDEKREIPNFERRIKEREASIAVLEQQEIKK